MWTYIIVGVICFALGFGVAAFINMARDERRKKSYLHYLNRR